MKPDAHQRKRDAGFMLVGACEGVLGVRGPSALAALTGRSKSWWSKLASGAAAFPDWEELEALLPAGLTAEEREDLHLRYRRVWLAKNSSARFFIWSGVSCSFWVAIDQVCPNGEG